MKVILTADVKKVGQKGQVVEVSDGYAQNVLLPRKLALPGTAANLVKHAKQDERKADKKAFDHALLAKTFEELNGKTVAITAKANEAGTLFEAIHEKQIAEAIHRELGLDVPESVIKLGGALKRAGVHHIQLEGEGERATVILKIT